MGSRRLAGPGNATSDADRAGGAVSRGGLLAERIGRLELEERAAVRRGDWATRLASQRVALESQPRGTHTRGRR